MKKKIITVTLACVSILTTYACSGNHNRNGQSTSSADTLQQVQTEITTLASGEVIQMTKEMFVNRIFDYEKSEEWKYKGDLPAIIDLYADWCGPCRMTAPIMKELAKEYAGKVIIYKVNVDKEKELAALFNATSIPLFVFIPTNGMPQLFRGAADKKTFQKGIDEFLLKTE